MRGVGEMSRRVREERRALYAEVQQAMHQNSTPLLLFLLSLCVL